MPYLVMGYVRGEPLSARLRRDGRLGADDARRVTADVAEALDYAHRKGVVHRDVKPDNIIIEDESGRAVLTDFGVAKAWGAGQTMTGTGAVVGTPQYMSPEQASGEATIDGRSDLYALGLVAYAMLAGRPPFEGGSTQDVLLRRLSREPRPLREAAPGVPEDLAEAIGRCLRRDPAARWADARGLREAVLPTGLEGERLPEPLYTLDGVVPLGLPFLIVVALTACSLIGAEEATVLPTAVLVGVAAIVLVDLPILFSAVRAARSRGFTWGHIAGAACRQPTWWFVFWYPRRFRRPGDMWDRLPAPFRAYRIVATLVAMDLVGLALLIALVSGPRAVSRLVALGLPETALTRTISLLFTTQGTAFLLLVVAWGIAALFGARVMRSRGFDTYTLRRLSRTLLTAPTSDRGAWSDPRLAALLRPPARPVRAEPRTPRELVRGLLEVTERLTGASRALADEAAASARKLMAVIEEREAEIAQLAATADPSETARLRDRRAALEAAKDAEARQMRELLDQQLALAERMWARLEAARAARERAWGLLRALWRTADEIAAGAPESSAAAVRALCDDASALASGGTATDATVTRTA